MRVTLRLLLLLGIFAWSSRSQAAAIDINVSRAGGFDWVLSVSSLYAGPIGAVALVVSDSLASFTPDPAIPPIFCVQFCAGDPPVGAGFHVFVMAIPNSGGNPPLTVLVPPISTRVLGIFHSNTGDTPQVLPADDFAGSSALDLFGYAIPDVAIHVVPEPSSVALVLAALSLTVGRRARSHGSGT